MRHPIVIVGWQAPSCHLTAVWAVKERWKEPQTDLVLCPVCKEVAIDRSSLSWIELDYCERRKAQFAQSVFQKPHPLHSAIQQRSYIYKYCELLVCK